jgi:hypothetical protein
LAGDRVHIQAGTYFECLRIEDAPGTETNPILFTGEGEVRIHCADREAISASRITYVTIEHMIVLSSGDDMNAIHIDDGSHHVIIRDNEVTGVGRAGDCIKVNGTDDVWVIHNDVHNVDTRAGSAQGIDLVAVHRATIRLNHVHDIADSQGIFAKGGASDIVIERNLIERIASVTSDAIGIVAGGVSTRARFIPLDADYEAIRVIVRNNIVIGADGAGIGSQGCHDCMIVNNTLWNCGRTGYAIQLSIGWTGEQAPRDGTSSNVNVKIYNNLIGNPYGSMRAPIQAEPRHREGLELSNNWWWNGVRDDVWDPGYNHEVGVDEPNSHVNEDPLVVDPDLPDIHLQANSPARNAGRLMMDKVRWDFDGACRVDAPDLGAYERP